MKKNNSLDPGIQIPRDPALLAEPSPTNRARCLMNATEVLSQGQNLEHNPHASGEASPDRVRKSGAIPDGKPTTGLPQVAEVYRAPSEWKTAAGWSVGGRRQDQRKK